LEGDNKIQELRKEVEDEFKKTEAILQENLSKDNDIVKENLLRELELQKKKIKEDFDKQTAILSKEHAKKMQELKSKYSTEEIDDERRIIEGLEEEITTRRRRVEQGRAEVSIMERDLEALRKKVLEEKEALLHIERGITASLAKEKYETRVYLEDSHLEYEVKTENNIQLNAEPTSHKADKQHVIPQSAQPDKPPVECK
jgi:hypothetical protein